MNMLSHVARVLGIEWAEQTFTNFERGRTRIPGNWPKTGADARKLVLTSTTEIVDPSERELLAAEVQRVARETWRELVSPD